MSSAQRVASVEFLNLFEFSVVSCLILASVEVAHSPGETHVVTHTPGGSPDNNDVIQYIHFIFGEKI